VTVQAIRITPKVVAEHGLSAQEYAELLRVLGREPNLVELGIFSVMWSEHCSYKSSKKWLKKLPTAAPWVICGPGENAGVIDIGDGQAAIFKMESHNHPSFIEPYQGAATGVGGILRDVFTMGARPIANLNALRFGAADHPKTRHLVAGVVAGIGGYGNCVGVPTVGGEVNFHPAYDGNILVNCMTVGVADQNRIFYSAAAGIGNAVVYVGSKTGRDGIHGATMASVEFSGDADQKRPTVQVGDPFTEKLLIEACLELMATDAVIAIQDMGAAGLTSSSFEMASKGGVGIELDLDQVPVRERAMTPYELMLSESQERMLVVLKPGREELAESIFRKWELDFAIIGRITGTGRMVLNFQGDKVADLPIAPLVEAAPEYDRPWVKTPAPSPLDLTALPAPGDLGDALVRLMGSPDMSSRRWIWEQYDHLVRGDTLARPGGDAAIVRVADDGKALAMTTDCTPRYCAADPETGGRQAVAEAWRNLTAVGAMPLAITDNMNFGNPQRPEIMGQFAGCIEGMRDACLALDFPVISGNVSLYNETNGKGILPTPAIGGVGLLKPGERYVGAGFTARGHNIVLIGAGPRPDGGHLGQSIYLREILGLEVGPPPPVNLATERRHGDFVRRQISTGHINACHDLSDGGLLVALAEMALAGGIGAEIEAPKTAPGRIDAWAFGEDQARYLLAVADTALAALMQAAQSQGVPAAVVGRTGNAVAAGGEKLIVDGLFTIYLEQLRAAHDGWLPKLMNGDG
jgi:phosphoribosylformylglycinamidine synthase